MLLNGNQLGDVYRAILSRRISCFMPSHFTPFRFNASSTHTHTHTLFICLLFFAVKRNLAAWTHTAIISAQIKTNVHHSFLY